MSSRRVRITRTITSPKTTMKISIAISGAAMTGLSAKKLSAIRLIAPLLRPR